MRLLRIVSLTAVAAILAACAPPVKKRGPTPFDRTVDNACYTVDMFTSTSAQPLADDVPQPWRAFSGGWGGGAWEGKWCHDLYVISIDTDGAVDLIETYAPYPERGLEATAFRRKGRITKTGRLEVRYRNVVLEYWVQDGRLFGLRREGTGEMRIKLSPKHAI